MKSICLLFVSLVVLQLALGVENDELLREKRNPPAKVKRYNATRKSRPQTTATYEIEEPVAVYDAPYSTGDDQADQQTYQAPIYQAPVYQAPAPVYQAPAPVYQAPAPVYQAPAPVPYQPYQAPYQAPYQPAYTPSVSYAPTSYYQTQYDGSSNLYSSYEQWCTDACLYRSTGKARPRNPDYSPKSSNFPSNYGQPQDFDDNNCHCLCRVPPQQDPDFDLCANYGDNYNACGDFCTGNTRKLPISNVGNTFVYLQGGTCLDDPISNQKVCNCHCKVYDQPMV